VESFIGSILLEDRSVVDLLTAKHTFVNGVRGAVSAGARANPAVVQEIRTLLENAAQNPNR
jgi:hypothetical protein